MNICRESLSSFCPREDGHSYIVCVFSHLLVYKAIFTGDFSAIWSWQKISIPSASLRPSPSNNECFVLERLPVDASLPSLHSLVWLLSRVLMGEGTQTIEFGEQRLWPGASATSQAVVDNLISVLGYRQPGYLSWLSSHLKPVAWKSSSSDIPDPFAQGPGEDAGEDGWEMAEGQVASLIWGRISPYKDKGCCGCCILGLQFTNEIKMPVACLHTHLRTHGLSCLMSVRNLRKAWAVPWLIPCWLEY